MNAEKFDIEKMLEADAESIEIDLDFKAKLKADIMKNNSSVENNNIIDFNAKTSEKTLNESKVFKPYRKYLKIASSFAIVGLIGFRVGVGNFGFAKVDNPKVDNASAIKVLQTEIYSVISSDQEVLASNSDNTRDEDKIADAGKVEASNSENEGANPNKDDNKINEKPIENNGGEEKVSTENTAGLVESGNENATPDQNENNDSDGQIEYIDNVKGERTKPNTDGNHDEKLKNQEDIHLASGNNSSENKENENAESILISYGTENALDLYCGTLSMIEDEGFSIQNNKVYIQNEDAKELIFTQEDNNELIGIKKVNENELLLYKASLGSQEDKLYQLSKLNISSMDENLLVEDAQSIVLNNTYDKLAFEIDDNVVIMDIKTEKQENVFEGKNIAWSPDGKYLSYVKSVREEEEGEKIKTYSSLVVYDSEENEETTLAENELIVMNDEQLIGTYKYGENLWSKDNKCIYVVRENISIMSDIAGNKKQVIKLTVMN